MKNILCYIFFLCLVACSKNNSMPDQQPPAGNTQKEKILLDEQFNNNHNGWAIQSINNVDSFGMQIDQSGYYLTTMGKNKARAALFPRAYFTDTSSKNQYIEASFWQTQGNTDVSFGIMFSTNSSNDKYSFLITSEGYYIIYSMKPSGVNDSTIINWTSSNLIKPMPNKNILKVAKQQENFTFFINGQPVAQKKLTANISLDLMAFQESTFEDDPSGVTVVDYVKLWETF